MSMNYGNITTQVICEQLPAGPIQTPQGWTFNPAWEHYRSIGWRKVTVIAQPAAGNAVDGYGVEEIDGDTCRIIITAQHNIAEAEAAEAAQAAERERLRAETPIVYDQVIQAKVETPAADGHIYRLEIEPTSGEVISVQRASTRLNNADYAAQVAAKVAARKAKHDAGKAGINGQLQARLENIERLLGWRA